MEDLQKVEKIMIFSATQKDKPDDTLLYKSISKLNMDCDVVFSLKNDQSLSVIYNKAIEHALREDYDSLVFIHDDVELEHDPIPKLRDLFGSYGLVGVAGCSKAELKSPALWHLMGGGLQAGGLHGAVSHGHGQGKFMTSFGVYPNRVLMIDGVFMALRKDTFSKFRFDESNPCKFHFYDLDFSYNCSINGVHVGVGDIYITHMSPGLKEFSKDWISGETWFLNKHNA